MIGAVVAAVCWVRFLYALSYLDEETADSDRGVSFRGVEFAKQIIGVREGVKDEMN